MQVSCCSFFIVSKYSFLSCWKIRFSLCSLFAQCLFYRVGIFFFYCARKRPFLYVRKVRKLALISPLFCALYLGYSLGFFYVFLVVRSWFNQQTTAFYIKYIKPLKHINHISKFIGSILMSIGSNSKLKSSISMSMSGISILRSGKSGK